ncbi:uncharacterized protein FOMMEDRAFT_132582 [Fomitiporia mediterranea MF3/22]|uniref:uncharacterized protein n=1 Tax=Fomitiporia mediterranea (strain MF3/22) TaxID=694068 RepID=UPI0004409777|nr:uncharacterized protein FOMMEDRAFT_132582 [Fomitiporia mediterranea MF3/22]EJD06244.1 hypothetical protein FOMMEDRAFT_132582 [Fomitiporia mediterranea MF3/22]
MGQSPSIQTLDYSAYDQKPRQRTGHYNRSPSCSTRTSRAIDVGDIGLLTSAQTLRDPQHRSRDVRSRMRHEENDSDYAFFCMFCDRSFGSNLELEQHLLVHDPAYPFINETTPRPNRLRAASMYSARVRNHTPQSTEPCRVCNKALTRERLLAHWLLAEAHRNVRGISDLQQTIDRPDLWCALCQTRFTHTDRKRKHMEEMNAHNLHYRELQSQALRDPNFDRSILEVPRITPPSSPPLPSRNVSQNHSLRATSMYCTRVPSPTPHPPSEPCQVCNKPHWLLAECHRNVRGASDLQQTTDRPELWCALCRTRFTHSDRKRKVYSLWI